MDPVDALREIAFHLERALEPTYRVQAYRTAAATAAALPPGELDQRIAAGTLTELKGIGAKTAGVLTEAGRGKVPAYLHELRAATPPTVATGGTSLRAALRGDCHTHSDWSDGGSPIEEMARTARVLGHEYVVLTDHSPRLTVANGLSPDRLRRQLDVVAELNDTFAAEQADRPEAGDGRPPFRILTGIEVDILEDGTLDQEPDLLARLDLVVASVHSKLRMDRETMTRRMVRAIADPHTDVLGHCTGRKVAPPTPAGGRPSRAAERGDRGGGWRGRPESEFDAELVFEACRQFDVAVEINSRPERLDPPRRLLRMAAETGCRFMIDTDAHAPGQLDWQRNGCARAEECGVTPDLIRNTGSAEDLLAWTRARG